MKKPKLSCGCGRKFVPIRRNQKHCSPRCRNREAQRAARERIQKVLEQQVLRQIMQ